MKDITVTFTQDEANALFTAMCCRVDEFTGQMKAAGSKGNTRRVLECAKWIEIMKSAQDKLMNKGATFWC